MLGFIAPNNFTFGDSLILVSIVLLGGIGNPWGVAVAAAFVVMLPEKFQVIQEYRFVLYAVLVILILLFRPEGLLPRRLRDYVPGQAGACHDAAAVRCRRLTRRFGGVVALDHVDFAVREARSSGLIGPNGSGKTTLFNVVTGIYRADAGAITFAGTDSPRARPQAIYRAGIARTFQRSRMCLPLSVFDNIMVGNHKRLNHGLVFNLFRRARLSRGIRRAAGTRRASWSRSSTRRSPRASTSPWPACR